MISATDVVKQIRRSLLIRFLSYVGASAILAALFGRYAEYGDFLTNFLTAFILAVCFAAIVVYVGRYIPIANKHESLLNKYGSAYLAEAERAMKKYGVDRMLSTRWFDLYADDFCQRQFPAGDV